MTGHKALALYAGPRARAHLREHGLRAQDVRVVPAAAGGPKGLVLNPLDRFIFGHWLAQTPQTVHLLGASIGAWRMACACMHDADAGLAQLAEDYIEQRYDHAPGRAPKARHVSEVLARKLQERLGVRAHEVLAHPTRRLHVFTSRGRHVLGREGRLRTPLGYFGAFVANAMGRRALGGWIERVVFSDPREPLPFSMSDFRTMRSTLADANLVAAVLASCSIPFWLNAVHDIHGGPRGAYWDGGITDYHLHLPYADMAAGLVLYPHFQDSVVPGWLDKPWKRRHAATPALDNVIVLAPQPDWVRGLPGAKLPDRGDFKAYADDDATRIKVWRRALAESQRLADEFAALVERPGSIESLPLR